MLTTKITYALADWIREWRKCRKENPSLDDCIKFTEWKIENYELTCLLYTSPSPRDMRRSRMPSSA